MVSSMQDETTPVVWWATRAGRTGLYYMTDSVRRQADCPRWSRKKNFSFRPYNKSIIYKACSAFVYVFFNKNSKKELGQYPAILTSHLKYYIKSKIFSFLHVIDSATLCTLKVRVFSFSANVCSGPYFTSHDPCA